MGVWVSRELAVARGLPEAISLCVATAETEATLVGLRSAEAVVTLVTVIVPVEVWQGLDTGLGEVLGEGVNEELRVISDV